MLFILTALFACSGSDPDPASIPAATPGPTPVPTPDLPAPEPPIEIDRYDPEHLMTVSAELAPAEWDVLLHETRLFWDVVTGEDCFTAPIPNVFEWHPGVVTIDGETLPEVGFRKKGFIGSLSWTRPSLKVDSDRFVPEQRFVDQTEHLTFNNNQQDPSRIHSCLGYQVFRAAGVAAPLCSFAVVEVNTEALGVYTNIEPIKNAFLRRNFGDADGVLFEGTVSDFNDDFVHTFDVKTDGGDLVALQELSDTLQLPDEALIPALEQLVDVDAFVTMWVVEGLIGHWDGYAQASNNFYVYEDVEGRLTLIPWGADSVFEDPTSDPLFTNGVIAARLWDHPEGRQLWLDEAQRVLDEVWDESALHQEIDRMEALIEPHLLDAPEALAAIDEVRVFVDQRRGAVEAVLAAPPQRELEDKYATCFEIIGTVTATFDTVWDSLEEDVFTYPATLVGDVDGVAIDNAIVGATIGFDESGARVLQIVALDATYVNLTQVFVELPEALDPGSYHIDLAAVPSFLIQGDLDTEVFDVVGILGGELVLDQAGYAAGSGVSGFIDAEMIPNFFD